MPARELSSPWPERIDVQSVSRVNDETYEVKGQEIGMAGGEIVGNDDVTLQVKLEDGLWKINVYELK